MKKLTSLLLACVLAPALVFGQTLVRLQPSTATGTLNSGTTSVTLTSSSIGGFGAVKIQSLDSYSGTWAVQCSLNGTTFDTVRPLKLNAVNSSATVTSVVDTVGIWDVQNAAGCKSIRVIETAGFAATDTAIVISATQIGAGGGAGGSSTTTLTLQEADDATIASGQNADVVIPLLNVFDGTNWKRFTVGTAGAASTQVVTVQGIAAGTNLNVTCSNCSGTGVSVNEDVASADAQPGTPAYAVRNDAVTGATSLNGDYQPLKSDAAGSLWVNGGSGTFPSTQSGTWTMQPGNTANTTPWLFQIRDAAGNARGANVNASNQLSVSVDNTVTVGSHAVTNAGTFATQESGAALTSLQLIDDPVAVVGTTTYTEATTKGVIIGGVRQDADATLVNTTNEIAPLQMDARGFVKVEAFSGETLPVSLASVPSHAVTNAGTFVVQENGAALTSLQLIDDPVATLGTTTYTEAATKGNVLGCVRRDANTTMVDTTNEIAPCAVDANGSLKVAIISGAGSGGTAMADDAAFTVATTNITPAGGTYKSVRDAVDDNDGGAFAMTQKRAVYSSLETPNADSVMDETLDTVKVSNATAANLNAAVVGTKTNNNAAPGATNVGSLPCVANATAPTWTEANQVSCSSDLHGSTRVTMLDASGTAIPVSDGGSGAATSNTTRTIVATDSPDVTSLQLIDNAVSGNNFNVLPQAATSGGASTFYAPSAASNNSTNVKASAGQVYTISAVNTTATLYFLRMYNLASAPTCSSATGFIETIPIPASTTGAGLVRDVAVGQAYSTGVGFCLTGGGSSTDNTNAATGVYFTILFK